MPPRRSLFVLVFVSSFVLFFLNCCCCCYVLASSLGSLLFKKFLLQLIYSVISFRYTAKIISYMYTYILSFLDSFSMQSITEYWAEFPVLYSRFLLVIYCIYSSVCMSIPIFQFKSSLFKTVPFGWTKVFLRFYCRVASEHLVCKDSLPFFFFNF